MVRCTMVLLLAGFAAPLPAAGDTRLGEFLSRLAPPPQTPIAFVEQRMSALLERPLEVRGELSLGSDGVIDKHVTAPIEERVRISATTLSLERGGQLRTVDLAGDARWRALHAGISGLLRRDASALERVFEVELTEADTGWTLALRPRQTRGANSLTRISAQGEGPQLLRLRLEQGEGEWQEMSFPKDGARDGG